MDSHLHNSCVRVNFRSTKNGPKPCWENTSCHNLALPICEIAKCRKKNEDPSDKLGKTNKLDKSDMSGD